MDCSDHYGQCTVDGPQPPNGAAPKPGPSSEPQRSCYHGLCRHDNGEERSKDEFNEVRQVALREKVYQHSLSRKENGSINLYLITDNIDWRFHTTENNPHVGIFEEIGDKKHCLRVNRQAKRIRLQDELANIKNKDLKYYIFEVFYSQKTMKQHIKHGKSGKYLGIGKSTSGDRVALVSTLEKALGWELD